MLFSAHDRSRIDTYCCTASKKYANILGMLNSVLKSGSKHQSIMPPFPAGKYTLEKNNPQKILWVS
jgi:hypothetical protein